MRVLVPIDDTERGSRAGELALDLFPGGTIVLLHVINPAEAGISSEETIPSFPEGWYDNERDRIERVFDEIEASVGEGATIERHVDLGKPARTIIDSIEGMEIDHVVMGSRGRKGVSRILLGSVAETVVRRSTVPVTVAR